MAKNPTSLGLPPREEYYVATVGALRRREGSVSILQLEEDVAQTLSLAELALSVPHGDGRRTQFQYDLAWVRTYLKWAGLVENPQRGQWQLTALGQKATDEELRGIWKRIVAQQRADRKQLPKLPRQGPGPHFAISGGVLDFAKRVDSRGNDSVRLQSLRPIALEVADALLRSLEKYDGLWPDLEKAVRNYRDVLSRDTSEIDYGRLFGLGLILSNALRLAKANVGGGNAYPLAAEPTVLADSLLDLHGPLILGTRDGQALVADAERFDADSAERLQARESEIELSKAIAGPDGPAAPEVKLHISDVVASDDATDRADRQQSYRGALVRNAAIVLVGGATMSTIAATALAGGVVPAALTGIVFGVFGKEAVKNSKAGKEISTQLTRFVDKATVDFVNDNEDLFRVLAKRKHMGWLNRALDWASAQRDRPGQQPASEIRAEPVWPLIDEASPEAMVSQAWGNVEFAMRSYALANGLSPNQHRSPSAVLSEVLSLNSLNSEIESEITSLLRTRNEGAHRARPLSLDEARDFVARAEKVYAALRGRTNSATA